jgi:hypothetical protein
MNEKHEDASAILVTPEALEACAIVASDDTSHWQINGVFVHADGRCIATDGHRMLIVPASGQDSADYPPGVVPAGHHAPTAGVIVPTAVALSAAKSAKRYKRGFPLLRSVAVSVNETHGALSSTDLDSTPRQEFRLPDLQYPNFEQSIPQSEPVLTVSFNADYLREMMVAMLKAGADDLTHGVRFVFRGKLTPLAPAVWLSAVTIEAHNGTSFGLLMPLPDKSD